MASELLNYPTIEQDSRPASSRLQKIAKKSGKYAILGIAGAGVATMAAWGISELANHDPSADQKYENAVVHAVEHPNKSHPDTFMYGDKRWTLKAYKGDLTLKPFTSIYQTPTDTAYNSHYHELDNFDLTDSYSPAGFTIQNGIVVSDGVNPKGGLWIGAPKPDTDKTDEANRWVWVHLAATSVDYTQIQGYSPDSVPKFLPN